MQLYENAPGTGVRKIHHKLMVIDERLIIAGSFNYTEPATPLNDENIVVLGDLEETGWHGRGRESAQIGRIRPGRDRSHHRRSVRSGVTGRSAYRPMGRTCPKFRKGTPLYSTFVLR